MYADKQDDSAFIMKLSYVIHHQFLSPELEDMLEYAEQTCLLGCTEKIESLILYYGQMSIVSFDCRQNVGQFSLNIFDT